MPWQMGVGHKIDGLIGKWHLAQSVFETVVIKLTGKIDWTHILSIGKAVWLEH